MTGAAIGSGTERALPARAADFGGTVGLGFDGPATGPPPNLSFIADTETGIVGSLSLSGSFVSLARTLLASPFLSEADDGPSIPDFLGGLDHVVDVSSAAKIPG